MNCLRLCCISRWSTSPSTEKKEDAAQYGSLSPIINSTQRRATPEARPLSERVTKSPMPKLELPNLASDGEEVPIWVERAMVTGADPVVPLDEAPRSILALMGQWNQTTY